MKVYKIGLIGLGKMGRSYLKHLAGNPKYEVVTVCDVNPESLALASSMLPGVKTSHRPDDIFLDPEIEVVGIFTYADTRPDLIRQAIAARKHIIAEKPLGMSIQEEEKLLEEIEQSGLMVAVNLFNRSAWYHREIQDFIRSGEIGQLSVIRISHQTPGDMPTESQLLEVEGAPFHTCGMHYIDVARWYACSEINRWDAQGVRTWGWKEPWWVHVHGSFHNGIVFDITQGFTYGQMAQTKTNNSGIELLGTLGLVRMSHDFTNATVEYFGVNRTDRKVGPYGGKNIDVLCSEFAQSLDTKENVGFPTPRDSVIASRLSWDMLEYATGHAPVVGSPDEMERILAHKKRKQ
jgi:predicted dehydrogenase